MVSPQAIDWFEQHLARGASGPSATPPLPPDVRVEAIGAIGDQGVAARWFVPAAADVETVIAVDAPWPAAVLFLPGSGVAGGVDPSAWAAHLAARSGVRVLLPESQVPGGPPSAAVSCYRWLLADGGYFGEHLAVIAEGDAAVTALAVLDDLARTQRGGDGPALLVLLSPWVDGRVADPLDRDRGDESDAPDATDLRLGGDLVHTVSGLRRRAPEVLPAAPATAADVDLFAVGQVMVHVGSAEILVGDALTVIRAFAGQDIPVTLRVWPYQQHGFHRPIGSFPEADLITDDIAAAARATLRS